MAKRIPYEMRDFSYLEKIADNDFSKFIRLRDSDEDGYCRCITCGEVFHWKQITNGHWQKRDKKPTRYNEENCHAQCVKCNSYRSGEDSLHGDKIQEIYGGDIKNELRKKGNGFSFLTKTEIIVIIYHYRLLWNKMAKSKPDTGV